MINKRILYVGIGITLLSANVSENEIGIYVGVTSTKNEDSSKFENPSLGVSYQDNRYIVMPRVDVEYVQLNKEKADALIKASINGVYEYENKTNVSPYVLAGIGYEQVQGEVKNVIESHAFIQGGAGLRVDIKNGYKARIEGRFLQILGGKDEENEAILTAGLSIPLSYKKPVVKPKPIRRIAPPMRVIKPIRPVIIHTPPKVLYSNVNECSIKIDRPDLDRDGVENRLDQCPNTPCNFTVDGYGCPIKGTLQINFATNSSRIRDYSMEKVAGFAKFLLKNIGSRITIVGHTDSVGSATSNRRLSYKRAKSVVEALIAEGLSPARVHAEGRGENDPIASNETSEGKAKNRRIEAILSYPKRRR